MLRQPAIDLGDLVPRMVPRRHQALPRLLRELERTFAIPAALPERPRQGKPRAREFRLATGLRLANGERALERNHGIGRPVELEIVADPGGELRERDERNTATIRLEVLP